MLWIAAFVGTTGEVVHFAVETVGQPLPEFGGVRWRFGGGDADEVEAECAGALFDLVEVGLHVGGAKSARGTGRASTVLVL